ncbi:MAG: hypothetical protein PHT33_16050 [bacterium]|nr:hypothetical protein [bacterium]
MRSVSYLRIAGLTFLTAVIFCCASSAPYLSPSTAYTIPEPGEPQIVGWFCPKCGGLVSTGRQSCSCGYSLGSQGGDDTSAGNTGGYTGGWSNDKPQVTRPAVPKVSVEERRQKEIYAREKQALLNEFKLPDTGTSALPVTVDAGSISNAFNNPAQPVRFLQASGLSEAEWARARACQAEINAVTRVWPVPEKNMARLENLLTERNTLWAKATSAPDLTAEDRERLRLKLFVIPHFGNNPTPSVPTANLQTLRSSSGPDKASAVENPVTLTLMRQTLIDSAVSMAEQAGEDWAGELLGDAAGARFGTVLGLAKVAIAARKDTAEGLAAMGDVLVGLIPLPQAGATMAAGRVYGNTAFQAMNSFMQQSMQATGNTMDTEAFWKELDDELSVNLRAYRKWVGFGS